MWEFKQIKDLYLRIDALRNLFVESIHEVSGVRRKFSWGGLVQGHMVVICIWCALFVTSQFDVMSMFPNQRFGEVC